jgi:hypothetical protein
MPKQPLTPEKAQELTLKVWEARKQGKSAGADCGWCEFSKQFQHNCLHCPVPIVFVGSCANVPEYLAWERAVSIDDNKATAAKIHALLVKHQEELIKVGYEIIKRGIQDVS